MIDLILKFAPPVAVIISAIIAARASWMVRNHVERGEAAGREFQAKLAELNHVMSIAATQAKEHYSLKAKALVEACRLAGEIGYYLERYLTSYTAHEPMAREALLKKAEETYEALMKYRWENGLFLWNHSETSSALGKMMGAINTIRNIQPSNGGFSDLQVQEFLSSVTPAIHIIREELSAELQRV